MGDLAPNFDLTSTADVVLMLCDEVPRTAVALYGFRADSERVRADLATLAAFSPRLVGLRAKVLVFSSAPLAALKALQRDLSLPFPLLHDDRGFLDAYGVPGEEPALFLVDRRQQLVWLASPVTGLPTLWSEMEKQLRALPSASAGVPKSLINRLVDRRVN